jgi:aminoglycoside 3-N-acetyltransferase
MNLLETISGWAIKNLDASQIEFVRNVYFGARTRLHPLMKAWYGTFDAESLRRHLELTVGRNFEVLMVHSSINHMLPMYTSTPLALVRMLMDYCGPERTLAMPAFYFGNPSTGGVYGELSRSPRFDLRRTPSQMGLATELFRRMPGVLQSRHPVYRVAALGPLAREITAGHELTDYPHGVGSPFDAMTRRDTCVIGIGKTYQVLTQAHHVEGVLGDAFPVPRGSGHELPIKVIDGSIEVDAKLSGRNLLWKFNIWKLGGVMGPDRLRTWEFHHVPLFATRARDVTNCLIEAARSGVTLYDAP